nr:hypothetical protein [Thermoplasmata archaeon]NIV34300.1 hypothetical protein [Anaerolineae bacterium]NIY06149.1 hypothetical protein [Thermoplasmata archaeon]
MATPTIKPHQVAESFVAVPGIIIEMIRSTVSPTATAVDGSWTDILTGTFEVPIAGTYKLTWNGAVYTNGGSGTYRANFRLNFDSGDQLISDSTTKITMYTGEERVPYFHQLEVELTAGTHTVAAQWIATTGSGVLQCNTDDFVVLTGLLASGSGAGGTLLASAENASDQTVSVDSTPVLLTDLSLNFTSVEEKVELGWHLHTYKNTGGSSPMGRAIFYRVDGGSWVHIANSSSEYEKTFSGSHVISVAPGSHTVDFAFMTNSQPVVLMGGGSTVPWLASAGFYPKCQTWVQRYRGGLVPVERDGEIVHSTPRALNFTGASLQVSESNDVVDIGLSDAVTAPGDLITLTDGPPGSALQINSSGDHQIMPETGSLSFEAKVTGTYAILLSGELIAISSNTSAQIKLVFDEGESYAQTVGYTDGWLCRPTTGNYTEPVFKDEVSLTAGTHTVKAYGKRVEGTGSVQITPGNVHPLVLTLQAIVGSGAGGMIVDHAVKDVDQNITANVLTALTGLTHTLTVGEDEDFDLSYAIIFYSGANHTSAVLYRVDGGDWIWTARKGTGGAYPGYLTGVETIRLTAGTHTIELGSVHDSGSTYTVYAPGDWKGATGLGSRSTIRQHRGGLVPIRNSGVQVVDKPAALNFEGALEVQNASGVANIRMPDAITAPGQIQTLTEGQPSSAINYDGTETQIYPESGTDSYTVTTAGKHRVDLNLTSAGNGADWNTYQYRVVFDEGLSTEVSIGYTEGWRARFNNGLWAQPAFSGNVDLEAKTYTIKVFGQRILGSGSAYISDTTLTQQPVTLLVTAVTGSGAAGILVDEALKPSDQTGISAGTITKITDLDLTFTASLGENVEISWEIFSALSTGTEAHRALFLKVDSGSWSFAGATFTGWHSVFDGSRVLEGLAAGSHTVEFGVRHDSGSTLIVYGTSEIWAGTGAMQSRTAATQFRGGLVPITDDFTTVDKPTSQKFVNASVTDDAGQAVVTLPEAVTVPGDLIEISDGIPSGAIAIGTDTQFIPETGSPMAFTVLSAGQYRAELDFGFYVTNGGTNTSIQVKLVFDEGEAHEQTLGYTEQWEARGIADGGYVYPHFGGTVDLTAGAHTLIAYAKETNGSDAVIAASAPRVTLTALAGSGAQGNLLAEAATTVNNTITATSASVLPTDPLSISFESSDEN